jgi:hypothetical protein
VSLALAGMLPPDRSRLALTAVSLAMMLAASGLAFGLIYRGHFSREEYLERELARCEERIIALRQPPTLIEMMSSQFGDISGHIRAGMRARFVDRAWRAVPRRLRVWWRRPRRFWTDAEKVEVVEVDPMDELSLPTAQLTELNDLRALRDQLRARWERLEVVENERKDAESSLGKATQERLTRLNAIKVEHVRALLELENAHDIARTTLEGPYARPAPPAEPVPMPRPPDAPNGPSSAPPTYTTTTTTAAAATAAGGAR